MPRKKQDTKIHVQIKFKVWFEKDGEPIMGQGLESLLKAVDETGSIYQAAKRLKMNYRKAFFMIREMEQRLGKKLTESYRGGHTRGGSTLTDDARKLLDRYERVVSEMEKLAKKLEIDV